VAAYTGFIGEAHAVDRESGFLVGDEDVFGLPFRDGAARNLVAVGVGLIDGKVDVDCVVLGGGQLRSLRSVDDVVGRGGDDAEVLIGGESETAEWFETRHGAMVTCAVGWSTKACSLGGASFTGRVTMPSMVWVLDLDGVMWRGAQPIVGSSEAVSLLRATGNDVVFVTNNAGSRIVDHEAKLSAQGVDAVGCVLSAAQGGAALLHPGETVLVVGGPGLREEVGKRGCTIVDAGPADAVICGLDKEFSYAKLVEAALAIRSGARWIATNPDVTYPTTRGLEAGAGALAAAITAASGVDPVFGGKPDGALVGMIQDRYGFEGTGVGDRPDTDGLFAVALGYRFGLVLSGVTTEADLPTCPAAQIVAPDLLALVKADLS
jgi:glycerol 3-phosphatase-2